MQYTKINAGAPVAFKTWWGHQYMVGIICLHPLVGIGLRLLPKLGVDTSQRPGAPHTNRLYDLSYYFTVSALIV